MANCVAVMTKMLCLDKFTKFHGLNVLSTSIVRHATPRFKL